MDSNQFHVKNLAENQIEGETSDESLRITSVSNISSLAFMSLEHSLPLVPTIDIDF